MGCSGTDCDKANLLLQNIWLHRYKKNSRSDINLTLALRLAKKTLQSSVSQTVTQTGKSALGKTSTGGEKRTNRKPGGQPNL